jgi:ribonuclease E
MKIPEGIGYIIRTEALGKTKTELKKDLTSLLKMHKDILAKAKKTKAPALVYQELDLVIRTIRDYFTAEIDEVLVDNPDVYQQARDFFKLTMPKQEHIVKLHQEKRPIFSKYQLEEQIDQIYEKKVPLKSGGSLVIEPTEALVSIDVNSGKSTGERGVEDTAFKTNVEAAEEAARQLRLRDLAGLIVIDFIDMRDKKHMIEVEKTLKNALKQDKARVTVGRISQFGMLEMSRQRIKQTLEQASYLECPHCGGRGKVKSVENMALSFLRKVHAAAAKGTTAEVRGALPLEVAYYLLNRKKRELAQIENDYEIEVTIKGKPSFLMNQLEIELLKRERPQQAEVVPDKPLQPVVPALAGEPAEGGQPETAVHPAAEEGKAKKKRRRKKKPKGEGEAAQAAETQLEETASLADDAETEVHPSVPEPAAGDVDAQAESPADEHRKKRKRRRRRGAKGHPAEGGEGAFPSEEIAAAPEEEPPAVTAGPGEEGAPPEEHRKKRKRKRRRGAKAHPAEGAVPGTPSGGEPAGAGDMPAPVGGMATTEPAAAPAATSATEPVAVKAKKPARPSRKKPAPAEGTEPVPVPPEPAPVADTAGGVKKARSRKKGATEEVPGATAGVEAVSAEKTPARKKGVRKKRETPASDTAGSGE